MKAFLMYKDHDFDLQRELPSNEQETIQDLELNTLFDAMALGDEFLFEVAKKAILSGENDLDIILYRQGILKDCLENPAVVRDIYNIVLETIENRKKHWLGIYSRYLSSILSGSIDLLQMFMDMLKKLKNIADDHADKFNSEGFTNFFVTLKREFSDEFFATAQKHLKGLKFNDGVLISAELGNGNEGTNYILRKPQDKKQSWLKRIFVKRPPVYTFYINPRDEGGFSALSEIKDRGINLTANTVAQSADHILSFFTMLRIELAFYIGCLNLYEKLKQIGEPITFPQPVPPSEYRHSYKGLYDVCLALTMNQKIVSNDLNGDNKYLMIITGANQGGKSTFLRSIGLAQLMMQCGMFVPAESFNNNICRRLFTHYKREEDTTMESGKFDEELNRMNNIVDNLQPNSMILFNESFAATNEREGSEIAKQIVCALLEKNIKIFFVTHLYEFSRIFYDNKMENVIFLRAERKIDGKRTFKIIEGKPLPTSYGEDLYRKIFGTDN